MGTPQVDRHPPGEPQSTCHFQSLLYQECDSELDDLGVVVHLVRIGIAAWLVPTALGECAARCLEALATFIDGEGDGLPGFRVPQMEAGDVTWRTLDRLAQFLGGGRVDGARIETPESCNAGNHGSTPPVLRSAHPSRVCAPPPADAHLLIRLGLPDILWNPARPEGEEGPGAKAQPDGCPSRGRGRRGAASSPATAAR